MMRALKGGFAAATAACHFASERLVKRSIRTLDAEAYENTGLAIPHKEKQQERDTFAAYETAGKAVNLNLRC